MAINPEDVAVLHPEEVRYWTLRQKEGKPFYPEEIFSVSMSDDYTGEQFDVIDSSCESGARRITEIAKLLGVAAHDWPSQTVLFVNRDGQFNQVKDETANIVEKAGTYTLGEFVIECAFASVPIEGQMDGSTSGMSLSLKTLGKNVVTFSSDNYLWYPEFEELTDEDGYTTEGEQVSAGGFSYKISIGLDKAPTGEVAEE